MELINKGKTKDVYKEGEGQLVLAFKDDVTGKDGVFDPGANEVGLTVEGSGRAGLRLSTFFFKLFEEKGIGTHFIDSDLDKLTMTVKEAQVFGEGLEFICRYRAVGSFMRRYGLYAREGQELDGFVEVTLKDDAAGDPPISKEALAMLKVLSHEDYETLVAMTREISDIIKEVLADKGLDLYDIKLEFGRDLDGNIILIDEVSGGNMRVYKGKDYVDPLDLPGLILD